MEQDLLACGVLGGRGVTGMGLGWDAGGLVIIFVRNDSKPLFRQGLYARSYEDRNNVEKE